MLLHWRRRGGSTRLPPRNCQATTSSTEQAVASEIRLDRLLLHRRPFPGLVQSEPAFQHDHSITPNPQCGDSIPVGGRCDAHKYGKHPFVSRLLPPVLFRKRQSAKQRSGMQRRNGGAQSHSVPALYFPSVRRDAGNTVAPTCAALRAPGGIRGFRNGHTGAPGGSAYTENTSPALQGTDFSKNFAHLSAAGVAVAAASTAAQGSRVETFHIPATVAGRAGRTSYQVPEMRRREGAKGTYDVEETPCRQSAQSHPPVARRYLNATATGRSAGRPRSTTKVYTLANRHPPGDFVHEAGCKGPEPGLSSAPPSHIDCSIPVRVHDDITGIASATTKRATSSAAALAPSRCRQVGQQKVFQHQSNSSNNVHTAINSVSFPDSTEPPLEKGRDTERVTDPLIAHRTAQTTRCFAHAATKSTSQKLQVEPQQTIHMNEANAQKKGGKASPGCFSSPDHTQVKVRKSFSSPATSCARYPQPVAGVQQRISASTDTGVQDRSKKTAPEKAYNTTCSQEKFGVTRQAGEQATLTEATSRVTTRWRSAPYTSLVKDKLRILWSVESLSDALVVRRGLATVLLIDGIGTAALLRRVLLKKPGETPQQQVQHDNVLTAVSTEDECTRLLNEVPAKVRSKSIILKILQGAVSLQQILPVDVTQAQADLQLLPLQQLLILRLRNYHDFELSSHYHSCHASFLRTLDCRIAELLGVFLVDKAYFDLFTPLVEKHKLQPLCVTERKSNVLFSDAGIQQSSTDEKKKSSSQTLSKPSFSGASTRCSSPQGIRYPAIEREEATIGTTPCEGKRMAIDEKRNRDTRCSEQPPPCSSLHLTCADAAVGKELGINESTAGVKKLRWGHLTRAVDAQTHSRADLARMCLLAPSETVKTPPRNIMSKSFSPLEEGEEAVFTTKELRKPLFQNFSREAASTEINKYTPRDIEKPGAGRSDSKKQEVQQESRQQHGNAAAAPTVGWRTTETVVVEETVEEETRVENANFSAEKLNASLIETQARFLVESAAARGLLSLYSPSPFGIPTGEALAARAQLRALGAAFVRQLGLIVSAAGKSEVNGNSTDNESISAADVAILQQLQKYVLEEKNEQQQEEVITEASQPALQDKSQISKEQCHEKELTTQIRTETTISDNIPFPTDSAAAFTRPDGVWVRLLVPWKPISAKKIPESVKNIASYSPTVTSPSTAVGTTDSSYTPSPVHNKGRQEEALTVKMTEAERTTAPSATAPHSSANFPLAAAAATAKTNLMTTLRVRRAKAVAQAERAVAPSQCGEEISPQWMEAFLWLRFPSPKNMSTGNTDGEAAADQESNQEVATVQPPQQGKCRGAALIARNSMLNRGVFELIVSNDRPVGEVLLWGVAPQTHKLLCKDSGLGCSSGFSPTGKFSKWTVALVPETAVLQQHLGNDAQVNDVVSELKQLLSRRCGSMRPPVEYEGGVASTAAVTSRAIL